MKKVEYSKDMKEWSVVASWTDEEATVRWGKLTEIIQKQQLVGFFRLVDVDS